MQTTDTFDRSTGNLKRNATAATDAALDAAAAVTSELGDLYNDVLDFVSRPELRNDPEAGAFRQKLERGLSAARASMADTTRKASRQAGRAVQAADDYAHHEPWRVAGVAALLGLAVGLLLSRR